ncbi:PIR protein CIR protein [Plasmodium vinckei lentum]|uniref:PIR protein CIR protein n=1 Tax=Plasmodium vinckei lentum TaxID=138297 RepID=A0A6V7SF66_PLAVN|nr:PIR protein CIR protein [Plasmodium vinckei lentum]
MEVEEMCKTFIAADTFYDGKNANITLEEISKQPGFKEYCHNKACNTRRNIISVLGAYLFMKIRRIKTSGLYDEYFFMWLGDKLFEIAKDEDKAQSKDITLNEAYDKYLKNNKENRRYWTLLDSIKGLKEANIKHMSDFYKLLNHICSTILDYNKNGVESTNLIRNSTNCSNQYMFLYRSIHKCKSYLYLLDNLKNIYYNFRDPVIKNNKKKKNLEINLQTLTTAKGKDEFFAKDFITFDFNSLECKPKKTKKSGSSKKMEQPPSPPQPLDQPKDNHVETPPAQQTPSSSQSSTGLQNTKTEGFSHQNGSEGSKSKPKDSENSEGNTGDTPGNKGNSNIENRSLDDRSSHQGSGGGSGASETQSTSWSYFGIGSYISTIASKGKEQLNNAVTSLETIKKKITETTNTIQNIYSRSMSNMQAAYDKSRSLLYGAIGNISSYSKQIGNIFIQNDDQSGSDDTKNGLPTPNEPSRPLPKDSSEPPKDSPQLTKDSPQTQKDSSQRSSKIPPTPPSSSSNGQVKTSQSSQDPFENQSSEQNNQGGSKIPVATPVVKQENSGIDVKGNETTIIGGIYALKKYKQIGISITVILIPIALAIMYKYLSYGRSKELKRKKNMKKVINSIRGKRSMRIIIKSVNMKKMETPVINPIRGKKKSLLNIYKLMQADPVPFINLFFLLIFFVYKRKSNYLEL